MSKDGGAPSARGPIVGIDLGTTYSVVAVHSKGRVEILSNDSGSRTTPSVVGFLSGDSFVGEAAKDLPPSCQVFGQYAPSNFGLLERTCELVHAKRLIGRPWKDVTSTVCRKNHWPFKVFDDCGVPRIQVKIDEKEEEFSPEEISGLVLRSMRDTAETVLGVPVTRAVITVPAYFNERQRQATKLAGQWTQTLAMAQICKIAGLEVTAMINEATAAAVAYGLDKKSSSEMKKKTIFIFDLGGGTFDVSVVTVLGNDFTVLASGGDPHLGGQDFDVRLMDHFTKEIRAKHRAQLNEMSIQELRRACELAKRKLSAMAEVPLSVYFAELDLGFRSTVSRALFEDLCADLFKLAMKIAEDILVDSKVDRCDIDEVVLVGGSTRIPKVRALLSDMFGGRELRQSINPDEAVAYGAAMHAANLARDPFLNNLVQLKDVTPLSLGTDMVGGRFAPIIARNTPIPCRRTETFWTAFPNQSSVTVKVYQGERPFVRDNYYLNKQFKIDVPERSDGQVRVLVTFELDSDGLLTVSCEETTSGRSRTLTLSPEESRVAEKDVEAMLLNAERFRTSDGEEKARIERNLGILMAARRDRQERRRRQHMHNRRVGNKPAWMTGCDKTDSRW
ncbi:Heat shock 70 kDa protein [Frankliniella fusca]|uniref:Heat shock 70 kDa protein n=1 Tax=Frankliniella fusca TaxID=407009 RepID=A0AAE1GXD7_9NEOP|nr:Heat shock 70 kDa protein [Frankliniella fusca]